MAYLKVWEEGREGGERGGGQQQETGAAGTDLDGELQVALVVVARRQVAVRDGKVRPVPDGSLVAHDGLVEGPLLLEGVAEVGVRVSELWADLDGLAVVPERGGAELVT